MKCNNCRYFYELQPIYLTPSNRRRVQLLDVTLSDIQRVAQKYLINKLNDGRVATAVLGEKRPWVDNTWDIYLLSLEGPRIECQKTDKEKVML